MDINECKSKGFIKITIPNKSKAISLIEIADIKEEAVRSANIDKNNVNAFLPMAYDALRETLEALCLILGYNVTNHVCMGELLRELVPAFDYHSFDRFRYARISINYYGKKVDYEQGKEMINKIFQLKNSIKDNKLKELLEQ